MKKHGSLKLENGSRVAVMGGGPAGSFFSYFLLEIARRVGIADLKVEMYEPRDFTRPGPAGCNMCGGVVSESLVQLLAEEGINLPPTVVQRGIDSYVVHMPEGAVRIETPLHEKRIAVVHRGVGPRGIPKMKWRGLDDYLLKLALAKGARHIRARVDKIGWNDGRPEIRIQQDDSSQVYDLLAVTVGVNTSSLRLFEGLGVRYQPPRTTPAYISEIYLGQVKVEEYLGSSMHVFLLNLPRVQFAALIPKGDYVTMCILGKEIDQNIVQAFIDSPAVKECLPQDWRAPHDMCHCSPKINIGSAIQPFADRLVFIGDCAVTRLYKDGIGGAYRAAKVAAVTAIFEGITEQDFRQHYWPACRATAVDNAIGKVMFAIAGMQQKIEHDRRGILQMLAREQEPSRRHRPMSMVMWDMFTGSGSYREVFIRTLHPSFWLRLLCEIIVCVVSRRWSLSRSKGDGGVMESNILGKVYPAGESIFRQGESGDCMFVIQSGHVEIIQEVDGKQVRLAIRGAGEFFGEMAIFEGEVRSATVRAVDQVEVLTLDRRTFLRRVHEDPSLALHILQRMAGRVREMSAEVTRLKTERENARTRGLAQIEPR